MTRERKEIFKKMAEIDKQESAELEMGCGFFASEIHDAFMPIKRELDEMLAATYNKTVEEMYQQWMMH